MAEVVENMRVPANAAPKSRGSAPISVFLLALAVLLGLVALFLAVPLIQFWTQPAPIRPGAADLRMPLGMFLQHGFMNGFTLLWFFAVGASFGSFMNVVTWRMPRRMNFVSQSSICPKCKHAIRGRHNLPVIGWIMLGGRCYDCGEPIAFRYPLVEICFGGAAFILCAWEVATGGWNLPLRSPSERIGFYETLWTPQWDLLVVFAFHFCLFVWLLTICLFEVDEEAAPRRFAITALVMTALVTFICPIVHPVSWLLADPMLAKPSPLAPERFSGLIGIAIGAIAALPAALLQRNSRAYAINLILAGMLVGGYLGWHAAVSVFALASLFALVVGGSSPTVANVTFATLVQILAWRWLHQFQWQNGAIGVIVWTLFVLAALFVLSARSISSESAK